MALTNGNDISKQTTDPILINPDHEDILIESTDVLIREYLQRIARPSSYQCTLRWTLDDDPNISYSILLKISKPSKL